MSTESNVFRHYPTEAAQRADVAVHILGSALAAIGAAVLLGTAQADHIARLVAFSIYALGLIGMLSFSLTYNLVPMALKPRLRRLDHVGIFLMIAGTYTPFTILVVFRKRRRASPSLS